MTRDSVETRENRPAGGDEPRLAVFGRRIASISLILLFTALSLATAPLWIPAALLVDAIARPARCTFRCALFLVLYLACELWGIAVSGVLWLWSAASGGARSEGNRERLYRLQSWWASALLGGARRIFGFRFEIEGSEHCATGPFLLFPRHASVADTVLWAVLVSRTHGIRLRYVLKRELLWDPCLDLVGNRLPNYFVHRGGSDSDGEREGVRALARDLGPRDGVLIYPEGTRASAAKRARAAVRLREAGRPELAQRAGALRHLLPPRTGGALALIEAAPQADVVLCGHTGFEGAATFWDLWNGALRGAVIRIRFERIPAAEIPESTDARVTWLYDRWQEIDRWVHAQPREA